MLPTNNKKALAGFSFFLVIFFAWILFANPWSHYKVRLFESDGGWGYEILADRKAYIYQPFMPAIEGQVPFIDKHSARKTGELVIKKLKRHKSPSITKNELDSLLN